MIRRINIALLLLLLVTAVFAQKVPEKRNNTSKSSVPHPDNLSDSALLDLVQQQTFRYFWDFAHPVSGMARERSNTENYGHEI